MSVSDLLYALLLASANDAAVTLAEGASGSVPAFVREMNRTAAALGLTGTHYENPIGLDSAGNYSTASDLATLTRRLRRERIFREIVDTEHAVLKTGDHTREITNRNTLLFEAPWVNGVKTGHTLDAGYVLVGSGTPQGRHAGGGGARRPERGRSRRRDARAARVRVLALPAGDGCEQRREDRVARARLSGLDAAARRRRGAARPAATRPGARRDDERSRGGRRADRARPGARGDDGHRRRPGRRHGRPRGGPAPRDEATFLEQVNGRLPVPLILIALGAGVILMGAAAARRGTRRRRRIADATTDGEEPMSTPEQERIGQGEQP